MARPKLFAPDAVLLQAIKVFWDKGFAATSMEDLVQAMGINRASLYNAFGNKHALYMKALEAYWETAMLPPMKAFAESGNMLCALSSFEAEGGCFLLGCMSELSARDEQVNAFTTESMGRIRDMIRAGVIRERKAGLWSGIENDDEAVSLLLTCLVGMRMLGKGNLTSMGHAGMSLLARTWGKQEKA